jgi:Kef-type K+ transport system membrane component KefB
MTQVAQVSSVLADLSLIVLAAWVAGAVFARLGQPPALGGLLAGALLGPHALGVLGVPRPELVGAFGGDAASAAAALRFVHQALATLAGVLLLLAAGLEVRVADVLPVGPRVLRVGGLGLVVPLALALGLDLLTPAPAGGLTGAFTAAALVASSVGLTAGVLRRLGVLGTEEARVILGAAALDDVLALVLLAAFVALSRGGAAAGGLALVLGQAAWLAAAVALAGARRPGGALDRADRAGRRRPGGTPFALVVLLTLGLAALAAAAGPAALAGALLAGMALAEAGEQPRLAHRLRPLVRLLAPVVFVVAGAQVNPRVFGDPDVAVLAAGLTFLAVAGKLVGGALGTWGARGRRAHRAAAVAVGVVPRGEVGLLIAVAGRGQGAVLDPAFAALVLMCAVTTLIAPPLLARLFRSWSGTIVPEAAAPASPGGRAPGGPEPPATGS